MTTLVTDGRSAPAHTVDSPAQDAARLGHAGADAAVAGFWMGGFEGADHVNAAGQALDMAQASGHLDCLDADFARAAAVGLSVVRESIGWRLAEPAPGVYDLRRALHIEQVAARHGLQVLWTLMHYGLPDDLSLHDDALIERFAAFADAVARTLGRTGDRDPVYTPINEIGFLAWCASQSGMLAPPNNTPDDSADNASGTPAGVLPAGHADSASISGYAVKRRLARAALAAIAAMRRVQPRARFMHVEPLVHVVPPPGRPDLAERAHVVAGWQWQAWDLLSGRCEPELGGSPAMLDLLGVNHYHSSQWELETERRLRWHEQDPRRRPLSALLAQAWQRYGVPLVLAETSHVGLGRAAWLHDIAAQVRRARDDGVPVHGVCLYPLIDRPDWSNPSHWHRSGLWHVPGAEPTVRVIDADYRAALQSWQAVLPPAVSASRPAKAGAPVSPPAPAVARAALPTLLMLAGARWSDGPQRGQELAMRLAGRWHVVYVEPARLFAEADADVLHMVAAGPDIDVIVPHLAASQSSQSPQALAAALRDAWPAGWAAPAVVWIDNPEAWSLAQAMDARALVCDVGPPAVDARGLPSPWLAESLAHWQARWQLPCARASLVLATEQRLADRLPCAPGGKVRVLGAGVDLAAFSQHLPQGWDEAEAALLQPVAPGTRVGFVGDIDASVDLQLLQTAADARPGWQWLVCGALRGVEPAQLPRRANLHWLGEPPRRIVPALMRGWQVAILPLRGDDTATPASAQAMAAALRALASGLPVVSASSMPGLPGGDLQAAAVCVAPGVQAFVQACDNGAEETAGRRIQRLQAVRSALAGRDWPQLADQVHAALLQALQASAGATAAVAATP